MKKILIVTSFDLRENGGAVSHIQQQETALRELGWDVELVSGELVEMSWQERAVCFATALGRRDRYRLAVTQKKMERLQRLTAEKLQRIEPDWLHFHDVYAAAGFAGKNERLHRTCLTVHGPASREAAMAGVAKKGSAMEAYIRSQEDKAYAGIDLILAVDEGQAEIIRQICRRDDICVLENCVDEKRLELTAAGTSLAVADEYFLVPRRLVEKNGVAVAIEAFLKMETTNVKLVIAGDGPLRKELLAQSAGCSEVIFLGDVDKRAIPQLIRQATGVIIPSVPTKGVVEATSIAALEAMGSGKPVLASAIGGLTALIEHGETGLLFPAGDSEQLKEQMTMLLKEPARCAALGQKAKAHVREHYSLTVWRNRLLKAYDCVDAK